MALDRTWYNALVDDDGSNTVGTVWGKDDIKNLLDSVDAEILRIDGRLKSRVTWTPTIQNAGGVTIAPSTLRADYAVIADQLHYRIYFVITLGGATTHLRVFTPAGLAPAFDVDETIGRIYPSVTSMSEWSYAIAQPTGVLEVRRAAEAQFAAGITYVHLSGFYFLR